MAFDFNTFGAPEQESQTPTTGFDFKDFGAPVAAETTTNTNWLKAIPDFLSGKVKERAAKTEELTKQPESRGFIDTLLGASSIIPRNVLRTAGQAAGLVGDVVGGAAIAAGKAILPKSIEDKITNTVQSIAKSKTAQEANKLYSDFKAKYPEATKDLEAGLNVLSLVPAGKGGAILGKEVGAVAQDVKSIAKTVLPESGLNTSKIISEYKTAIKPSVTGKGTLQQVKNYDNAIVDSVDSIVKNKANLSFVDESGNVMKGELPKTVEEFSQAVDSTKKEIFKAYDELAKKSGETGGKVYLGKLIPDLDEIINNKSLQIAKPEAAKYASELKNRLAYETIDNADGTITQKLRPALDTSTIQDVISHYNNSLSSFYRNPSYDAASRASIDALVVNKLRTLLDETIAKSQGDGYSILKKKYGSLKQVEKDVIKRGQVIARQNAKGLIDFTDIGSGASAVYAITNMNPQVLAASIAAKGIKAYLKWRNSPDRAIKSMFETFEAKTPSLGDQNSSIAQSLMSSSRELKGKASPKNTPFVPKSQTGKFLQEYIKNPKLGLSVRAINPIDINEAVFNHLDELKQAVSAVRRGNGKINLNDIEFLDRISNIKTKDLTPMDVRRFYELAATVKRTDIVDSINQEIATKIKPTFKQNPTTGKMEGSVKPAESKLLEEAKKYKSAEEFVNKNTIVRGDTTKIPFEKLNTIEQFKPGEKEALSAFHDTPGLYFTDSIENASSYGKNITKVAVNPKANIIDGESAGKILSRKDVEKIVRSNPELEMAASNWSENVNDGITQIVDTIMEEKNNGMEFLKSIWADGGFSEQDFVNAMKKFGIDGIKVGKQEKGWNHFIFYNKDALIPESKLIDIWNKANKK